MTRFVLLALGLCACTPRPVALPRLAFEQSEGMATGAYAEALAMCRALAHNYPRKIACPEFGRTRLGYPLVALVISDAGILSPTAAQAHRHPVILVQAGIHAGEIEGKDAAFRLARDYAQGKAAPEVVRGLHTATLVIVPVINPDGHERRSANNRPNQRGPVEMGFRTTSVNLNLNRDFMKLDSVELQAEIALLNAWAPMLFIDIHTTDGAKFQHDVAVMTTPFAAEGHPQQATAGAISAELLARLTKLGHKPVHFYPSFRDVDQPSSGIEHVDPPPRFSNGYAAQRGMIGMLVENHSWQPYAARVKTSQDVLASVVAMAGQPSPHDAQAEQWRRAVEQAQAALAKLHGPVTLAWKATDAHHLIPFEGYAYQHEASAVSGQPWVRYDETRPMTWTIPLYDTTVPALTVEAPSAGYIIDGGYIELVRPALTAHGIACKPVAATPLAVEEFRADQVEFAAKPYEGRQRATVHGQWRPATRTPVVGACFVSLRDLRAKVIMGLLEPTAPDSFVAWGFFNSAFEQKEYMEAYVAEEVARHMLANDPAQAAAYAAKLQDPAFAADGYARLDFFYRRHPSYDERLRLVPIFRVATPPAE